MQNLDRQGFRTTVPPVQLSLEAGEATGTKAAGGIDRVEAVDEAAGPSISGASIGEKSPHSVCHRKDRPANQYRTSEVRT